MKTIIDKTSILQRIKEAKNFSKDIDLANYLNITTATLSNWYKRNSINYDLIFSKCDDINLNWLITGYGSMIKENSANNKDITNENKDQDKIIIQLVDRITSLSLELGEVKEKLNNNKVESI